MNTFVLLFLTSLPFLAGGFGWRATSEQAAQAERVVEAGSFAGDDLGTKLRAADAALGKDAGLIRISSPGSLTTPVTLALGHSLLLAAPVSWESTMTLSGANDVGCHGNGSITAATPAGVGVFAAKNASHVTIHNCLVRLANNGPVLAGEGVHQLSMSQLSVLGGTIAQINAGHGNDAGGAAGDLQFTSNVVQDALNTGGAALLLVNTTDATVTGNTFNGISTGTQWWGGDSANGNIGQVNRTGKIHLSGNQCHAVTACLWGSMGYAISVTHNKADGCADVCFDTEGGLDNNFDNNVAANCGNGCGAIFFFSRNINFRGNDFSADARGGGLIFIKNRSADPRSHVNFSVSGNKLTCLTVCNAFYQEAVSEASFQGNVITNGVFATAGFGQNIAISQNEFAFSRALNANASAIGAPSITGGTTLTVEGNTVSSSVLQGPNSACISAIWNDYNNSDMYYIRRNRCQGVSSFPVDIVTNTAGTNPGVHADWHIDGNLLGAGNIVHRRTTTNEAYSATNNCKASGCTVR